MPLRIFLSGRFDTDTDLEIEWLKRTGCKYRCFAYSNLDKLNPQYNIRLVRALKVCEDHKIGIMLDSGAATLHNIAYSSGSRGKTAKIKAEVDIEATANALVDRYMKYCRANKKKWTFFVTLDFAKHQPTIFAMQERFEAAKLRPVPVYHGDAELDWLNKYADKGYKLIGLGNFAGRSRHNKKSFRYFLANAFNRADKLGLSFHGLAVTSLNLMLNYPWWSVDSTTWAKTAAFGAITFPDYEKGIMYNLHVSEKHSKGNAHSYNNMSGRHRDKVAETAKSLGFDIKLLRTSTSERQTFNGYVFSHLSEIGIDANKVEQAEWEHII